MRNRQAGLNESPHRTFVLLSTSIFETFRTADFLAFDSSAIRFAKGIRRASITGQNCPVSRTATALQRSLALVLGTYLTWRPSRKSLPRYSIRSKVAIRHCRKPIEWHPQGKHHQALMPGEENRDRSKLW